MKTTKNTASKLRSLLRAAPVMAIVWLMGGVARAQEFVKVENVPREQLPAPQFVAAAYGFIMAAILVYVVVVARRLAKTHKNNTKQHTRVERATGQGDRR